MTGGVILFTASWCKKCKEKNFLEVIETVKETYSGSFDIIDIDDEDKIDQLEIEDVPTSVPTILILESDGKIKETYNGQREIIDNLEMALLALY
jgi:thioredoxin-like negative regulator of GroEL